MIRTQSSIYILFRTVVFTLLVSALLAMTGCGDYLTWLFPKSAPDVQSTQTKSLDATITQMEANGSYPILDRSSDIKGPDQNNNGVRDDIEAYITSLPHTALQKQALMQLAKANGDLLTIDLQNKAAVQESANKMGEGIQCVFYQFKADRKSFDVAEALVTKLEALNANTRERIRQYMAYNRALSGMVIKDKAIDFCHD